MRLDLINTESQFKVAFTTLFLFPTPIYILLPYCRKYNSLLSLFSLMSISFSVYILQVFRPSVPWLWESNILPFKQDISTSSPPSPPPYIAEGSNVAANNKKKNFNTKKSKPSLKKHISLTPIEKYLTILNLFFSLVIAAIGFVEHHPWRGFDYLWILPLISISTTILLRKWVADAYENIEGLRNAKYPYKGA